MKKYRYLSLTLTILWCILIFWFSAQDAVDSLKTSTGLLDLIISKFKTVLAFFHAEITINLLRKSAHAFVYFVLEFLCMATLLGFEVKRPYPVSLLLCLFYAMTDEFHQYFVPGRAMQLRDICIDFGGCLLAFLIIAGLLAQKRKFTKKLT